jgi:hypothetical protein
MPTTNPRVNVVLDKDLYKEVKQQAQAQGISLSLKIRDLVAQALNMSEDKYWLQKANTRRQSFKKTEALTHSEVWED